MSDVPKEFSAKAAPPLDAEQVLAALQGAAASAAGQTAPPATETTPTATAPASPGATISESAKKILLEMQETGFSIQSTTPGTNTPPVETASKVGLKLNKQIVIPIVPKG